MQYCHYTPTGTSSEFLAEHTSPLFGLSKEPAFFISLIFKMNF